MIPRVREEAPVYVDAEQVIRRRGTFLLALSLAAPSAPSLRALAAAIEQLDSPALLMVVIDSSARAPDGPAKDAIRQVTVRLQHRSLRLRGRGRGLRGRRSPTRHLANGYDAPRIVRAVDEMRKELRPSKLERRSD